MREGGLVRVQDGTAVVGDLDTLDVPATIEGAVLSRVDRLTAGQLHVPEGRRRDRPLVPVAHGDRHAAGARGAPRGAASTWRPSPGWT